MNVAQDRDRIRLRDGVRVGDQHELVLRLRGTEIRVRGERERMRVLEHARALRQLGRNAARDVRDHEQLVDLRRERGQRLHELAGVTVRDDDCRHLHASASR